VRLFLLCEAIEPVELEPLASLEDLEAMLAAGLLVRRDRGIATADLLLLPIFGRLAFVPARPRPGWLGEERVALIARVAPPSEGRSLDLCTDTGAAALHLATARTSVVAVDDDPAAIRIARLNVAMAGLGDRVDVRHGDLWLAAAGERFERVVAAPATLPRPPGLDMPAHGGPDGLAVVSRIVGALPRVLSPTGTGHLIGALLGDATPARALDAFARAARALDLGMTWTLPGRIPVSPEHEGFDILARACARAATVGLDVARHALATHLANERADHLYLFSLAVTRERTGFHVTRHYAEPGGFWFG
jgi:methylase of polypeptide subunit release factors